VHKNGDAKVCIAQTPGATEVEPGVVALTWALIRDLYERGEDRRAKGASS
jgi:hypothetical protein